MPGARRAVDAAAHARATQDPVNRAGAFGRYPCGSPAPSHQSPVSRHQPQPRPALRSALHRLAPALVAALLAGCTSAPPRLETAALFDRRSERSALVDEGAARADLAVAFAAHDAQVRRAALELERAQRAAEAAGRLPDPTLSLEALYLDFDADDPWLIGGALEFVLPFLSTRDAERAAAEAGLARAAAHLAAATRDAALDATLLWIEAWSHERRRALQNELAVELDTLARLSERLAAAGELDSLAARRLGLAAARARLDALASERERVALTDRVAARLDVPVAPRLGLESDLGPLAALDASAERLDPDVAIALAELDVAEERLRAAARGAYDGASLGPAGEWEDGQARYGLALSLPIPISGRTAALRAVALVARRQAALEVELAAARVDARRRDARRELAAARRDLNHVRAAWTPIADVQWTEARALFEVGEARASDVQAALDSRILARLAELDARTREALAAARLARIGSSRPVDTANDADPTP